MSEVNVTTPKQVNELIKAIDKTPDNFYFQREKKQICRKVNGEVRRYNFIGFNSLIKSYVAGLCKGGPKIDQRESEDGEKQNFTTKNKAEGFKGSARSGENMYEKKKRAQDNMIYQWEKQRRKNNS